MPEAKSWSKAGVGDGAEVTFQSGRAVVSAGHLAVFIMTFSQNFKHTQHRVSEQAPPNAAGSIAPSAWLVIFQVGSSDQC